MCTVIDVIPFDNVGQLNSLLRKIKDIDVEIIDHAIVIKKWVRYEWDDRI